MTDNARHGYARGGALRPEYCAWRGMKERCYWRNGPAYHHYGGRGIKVCDRWRDSFENFLADMGDRPEGTTLDRIDVNGNYEPGNCRWASLQTQNENKRNVRLFTHKGVTRSVRAWARVSGVSQGKLERRLKLGWSLEKSLNLAHEFRAQHNSVWIEFNGEKRTLHDWARRLGIHPKTLYARINSSKWPVEKALTTPGRSR